MKEKNEGLSVFKFSKKEAKKHFPSIMKNKSSWNKMNAFLNGVLNENVFLFFNERQNKNEGFIVKLSNEEEKEFFSIVKKMPFNQLNDFFEGMEKPFFICEFETNEQA